MSDTQTIARNSAAIATPLAGRYLVQLCKHFEHKRPVTYDAASGHIGFSAGDCRLRAEPGSLTVTVEAPDEPQLAQLQEVVARHLLRFAFRESLQVEWRDA